MSCSVQARGCSAVADATPAVAGDAAAPSDWLTGPADSPVRMPRLAPAPPSPVRPSLNMSLQVRGWKLAMTPFPADIFVDRSHAKS